MRSLHRHSPRSLKPLLLACACLLAAGGRAESGAAGHGISSGRAVSASPTQVTFAPFRRPAELFLRATEFRRDGNFKEAVKSFKDALKLLPTSYSIRMEYANTLLLSGQAQEAAKEGVRVFGLNAYSAYPHYVLGMLYLNTEYPAEDSLRNALQEAEAAIKADANSASVYLLKAQVLIRLSSNILDDPNSSRLSLEEAGLSLEKFLSLAPTAEGGAFWRGQLAVLHAQARYFGEPPEQRTVFVGKELSSKAVVSAKPLPAYSEEARRVHTVGSVKLRMILTADGDVENILVLKGLPNGLTEQAVQAARSIRFNPGSKDGHAVSQFVTMDYHFNIS